MRVIFLFICTLLAFSLACEPNCAEAKPQSKKTRRAAPQRRLFTVPFTHIAQNEPLGVVLAEFARVQGFSAFISPQLKANVTGTFQAVPPYEFLSGMQAAYHVMWYQEGRTITFYDQSERDQAFLTPSVVSARELKRLFAEAGILSNQIPVQLLADKNMLFVRGPSFYITKLKQAMDSFEAVQVKRTVMRVFPLQHAWAEDKEINGGFDTVVKIPGVATILQSIVSGQSIPGSTVTRISPVQQGLLGQGLAKGANKQSPASPLLSKEEMAQGQTSQPASAGVTIIADPRMNAVVVHDSEYRMDYYARIIRDLDKPVRLVEIHAAIVDIDSNFKRELGVNFQGGVQLGSTWRLGGEAGASAVEGTMPSVGTATSEAGLSFSTLYTRGTDFFLTRVRALEEDGVARMLGRPSVLTTDNVQATLQNTNTYYIPVSGYQATDLFKVETGTVLSVTPHIIPGKVLPDGTILPEAIKLIVTVQDNRNDNSTFTVSGSSPQPLKQTKINTQAIVSHGQSLLIGGYYYEAQSDSGSGIPGLKNIPLLGRLFGSKTKDHSRLERLILITPRVISVETPPQLPKRLDDPRFSRSPSEPSYAERVPQKPPVGGCTRRRLDYASSPDLYPKTGELRPVPLGEPAEPLVR